MNTYAIRRKNAWRSPQEVQAVAKRAKEVADRDFPSEVRWIRSYVLAESGGSLGAIAISQGVDDEAIRRHSHRVGMPADEILGVADTAVIRPDPVPEPVAG